MKEKPRRLPLGGTTTNPDEYLDAWEALAAPLCKRFGWTHLAFDPDFQFDTEDGTVAMSPRAVKQIADALAEVHSEREELNRLRRLVPTGTYTLNVAHEEELERMREALRAAEKRELEALAELDEAKAAIRLVLEADCLKSHAFERGDDDASVYDLLKSVVGKP